MMQLHIPLIIIYNHKFEKNIEILEKIYAPRFSKIFHLMPFYRGNRRNVIPVYEHSFCFQGYVAKAFKYFFDSEFSHYLFISDDLLLNPSITEKNIPQYLNIDSASNFIPELIELHKQPLDQFWSRIRLAYEYKPYKEGVEIADEIPSYNEAIEKLKYFGLSVKPLKFAQIYQKPRLFFQKKDAKYELRKLIKWLMSFPNHNRLNLKYPLIRSYSDIFLISKDNIRDFCHYCGAFAASRLFVEFAIPTAIVLTAKKITTEKNLSLEGKILLTDLDYEVLDKFDKNLDKLMAEFPGEWLYVHPIKLSRWL